MPNNNLDPFEGGGLCACVRVWQPVNVSLIESKNYQSNTRSTTTASVVQKPRLLRSLTHYRSVVDFLGPNQETS